MDKTKCYTYVNSNRNIIGEIKMLCENHSRYIIYHSNKYVTLCPFHLEQYIKYLIANNIDYIISDI